MENISYNYCSCPTLTGIDDTYGECGACGPSGKRISKTVNDKTIYTICFDPTCVELGLGLVIYHLVPYTPYSYSAWCE